MTRTGHPAGPVPGPVVGLLLAAGIGRRFDPEGRRDKLLADAGGIAVATRAARNLADACDRVIAVVRPGASTLREALAAGGAAEIVECPDARLGMGHSLAHGAFAASVHRPRRIVLALADMPWIEPATIRALVAAADAADAADGGDLQEGDASTDAGTIAVPVYHDQRGHPVVFGAAHLAALGRCEGDRGAAALLSEYPVERIAVEDAGVIRDVDKPADLLREPNED